jgi:hypothetical protein
MQASLLSQRIIWTAYVAEVEVKTHDMGENNQKTLGDTAEGTDLSTAEGTDLSTSNDPMAAVAILLKVLCHLGSLATSSLSNNHNHLVLTNDLAHYRAISQHGQGQHLNCRKVKAGYHLLSS